jgi:hypothetical protein
MSQKNGILIGVLILAAIVALGIFITSFFSPNIDNDVTLDDNNVEGVQDPPEIVRPVPDVKPNDADDDGLSNDREAELGTDPRDYDTDDDKLTDFDEVEVWGTDPLNNDTDGDGFLDGFEVINKYNPNGNGPLES